LIHFNKRLRMRAVIVGLVWLTCLLVPAWSSRRVLVVLDNPSLQESHSLFLAQLTNLGFDTDIKMAEDPALAIKKYGEYLYDNMILLTPTAEELGGGLTAESVIEFIDDGGNVFIAAGPETGDLLRDIASECGVELDESGTAVIDHLHFDAQADEGLHNLIVADPAHLIKVDKIVGRDNGKILYRGLGMVTDPSNPLVLNILTGSSTSYSHAPGQMIKEYPHAVGKNTLLVAGLQARNNARVVVTGSLEMLSDTFYSRTLAGGGGLKAGNEKLVGSLLSWCFQQSGVIRIDAVTHKNVGEEGTPAFYTIRDDCEFSLKMSELVNDVWVPFKASDVQMEFVRIDPFVRQQMINKNGVLTAKFKIPDVYGVFKFKVDYARLGMTRVATNLQVSVHPLWHNQYERFIYSAYPYYASSFSMMAGVFLFAFVFLHFKEDGAKTKSE